MTVYQLIGAVPKLDTDTVVSSAETVLTETVLPQSRFSYFKRKDESLPPEPLQSNSGQEYINTAFDSTQTLLQSSITTLRESLCDEDSQTVETLLNDSSVRRAAFELGQDRGTSTYLYTPHGTGIRTQQELDTFLKHSPITQDSTDEYYAVVPFSGKH